MLNIYFTYFTELASIKLGVLAAKAKGICSILIIKISFLFIGLVLLLLLIKYRKLHTKGAKIKKQGSFRKCKSLAIFLTLIVLVRFFLFVPVLVYGGSMMPTIKSDDVLVINKFQHEVVKISRYDIVVFYMNGSDQNLVKRVIGLPGETIEYKNDNLYVNKRLIPESYLDAYKKNSAYEALTENFTLEELLDLKRIPKDHIFVLGDNRKSSRDSREIGVIPIDKVLGTANIIIWPLDNIRILNH